MGEAECLIGLVGDLLVDRDRPASVFDAVREVLRAPDLLFGNLEGAYSDSPGTFPTALSVLCPPARNLEAFAAAGFDVLSLANNHILDGGYDALSSTRDWLAAHGITSCGAGANLREARRPAVIGKDAQRIAFLAYSSTFPMGFEATPDRPGLAPLRAYNHWREQFPSLLEPGMPPVVATIPDQRDLANLVADICAARAQAGLVIVSCHWGDYTRPYRLTDHEVRTARYCLDHGADMVVGHHHHALRGVEWYRGKPIFYGLGHFVFDRPMGLDADQYAAWVADLARGPVAEDVPYAMGPRVGWPLLPMHEDTRMTCMAWAKVANGRVNRVGILPCRLTPDGLVHPLELDTPEARAVIDYLDRCNRSQKLNAKIVEAQDVRLGGYAAVEIVPGDTAGAGGG